MRALALGFALIGLACAATAAEVVVYTSVDQIFAEPVLERFERETGIKVKAAYDVEATKTVGLEKRLVAERKHPQADVFWNSEHLRTLRLKAANVLMPYRSPLAEGIPADFRDTDGYWTGFGARMRVFIVNTTLLSGQDAPRHLWDLADPRWKGRVAIAKPFFGTTSTHFAALYQRWGEAEFSRFLSALKANEVALLPGNAAVRDAVVRGDYAWGLTDTDDAREAIRSGAGVSMVFPDQTGDGAYAIPHTVAMVAGGPNPLTGRRLIDFLLSPVATQMLIDTGAIQAGIGLGHVYSLEAENLKIWQQGKQDLIDGLEASARLIRRHLVE